MPIRAFILLIFITTLFNYIQAMTTRNPLVRLGRGIKNRLPFFQHRVDPATLDLPTKIPSHGGDVLSPVGSTRDISGTGK